MDTPFLDRINDLLDALAHEYETLEIESKELLESDSPSPEEVEFVERYQVAIRATSDFRWEFGDKLSIGGAEYFSGNPFKTLQLVQTVGSKHMTDGPIAMNTLVNNWYQLHQMAVSGVLPLLPGAGLQESSRWRGRKVGSTVRQAMNFISNTDNLRAADEMVTDLIIKSFSVTADKYGLGEKTSNLAAVAISLVFAWKDSQIRKAI